MKKNVVLSFLYWYLLLKFPFSKQTIKMKVMCEIHLKVVSLLKGETTFSYSSVLFVSKQNF